MNPSIKAIVVTGKYGAGKSTVRNFFAQQLRQDFPWLEVISESDRAYIDEMVVKDVGGRVAGLEGEHSKLIAVHASGDLEWAIRDGSLHNIAHEQLFRTIADDHRPQRVRVVEIAIGPDISFGSGKLPLLQSGRYLLGLISSQFALQNDVLVVEVESTYDIRFNRNSRRPDPVPEDIFVTCATDEGEIWGLEHHLPHYICIRNMSDDPPFLLGVLGEAYRERIQLLIPGEGVHLEEEGHDLQHRGLEKDIG